MMGEGVVHFVAAADPLDVYGDQMRIFHNFDEMIFIGCVISDSHTYAMPSMCKIFYRPFFNFYLA